MDYDFSLLRGRIIAKWRYQNAFAEAIGETGPSVTNHLNGKVTFTPKMIEKYAEALDIPVEKYGQFFFSRK